jgi:hypothetical protein
MGAGRMRLHFNVIWIKSAGFNAKFFADQSREGESGKEQLDSLWVCGGGLQGRTWVEA